MTTIAFRDGVVAADSRISIGGVICPYPARKLTIGSTHPVVYAIVGGAALCQATIRLFESMKVAAWDQPDMDVKLPLEDGDQVIVFHRDGRIMDYEGQHWLAIEGAGAFAAFGSGMIAATAAMHMGADARRAIEIASLCDKSSGGEIRELRVADIAKPLRNRRPRLVA